MLAPGRIPTAGGVQLPATAAIVDGAGRIPTAGLPDGVWRAPVTESAVESIDCLAPARS